MFQKNSVCVFFLSFMLLPAFAQIQFTENKGQWDNKVHFRSDLETGAFFLQKNGFTVLLNAAADMEKLSALNHGHDVQGSSTQKTTAEQNGPITIHSHAYNVTFNGAASNPEIIKDNALPGYTNFFMGNDPAKWQGNCKTFESVTYKNVYPNIDLHYYSNAGKLKYDIIVHPGGNMAKISMQYDGVNSLAVKNGELVIGTSVGEVKESYPYTYQVINKNRQTISCNYVVENNTVKFKATPVSANEDIVIDPTLIFSSFTGGLADSWGFIGAPGKDGAFYSASICFATGFPVSVGAFDQTFNGGFNEDGNGPYDIAIMKFSANGANRLYATYLGGSGNEQPQSMICDAQDNLILTGRSSSSNFPLTTSAIGTGGSYDIIAVKLNANGTALLGSVKIGGSSDDGINIKAKYVPVNPPAQNDGAFETRRNYGDDGRSDVLTDAAGNIFIVSQTQSTNFPVTGSAFQNAFGGGRQDGVIMKFDPLFTLLIFSTYFGGTGSDACFSAFINAKDGSMDIAGATTSSDLPGDKAGVMYSSYGGGETDGFVTKISGDGAALIKTTYIGTTGNDIIYGIQSDRSGYLYIVGTTTGNFPVINAAFSNAGGKQFIAKLNPDLSSFVYSTVFGTNSSTPNISPTGFYVDKCQNVYVSGWGGKFNTGKGYPNAGTAGLTVTGDATQSTTDGDDFYFFVLEKNAASQLYGSFFGQAGGFNDHADGGMSRFDDNGTLYQSICANCGNTAGVIFPTTPGVWAPTNGSLNCNTAAVKIAFGFDNSLSAGIKATVDGHTPDTTVCTLPLTVNFTDTIAEGKKYTWNFGDGSSEFITTNGASNINHTYTLAGLYRARLVSVDSNTCNIADTSYTNIKAGTCNNICTSSGIMYTSGITGNNYQWQIDNGSGYVDMGDNTVYNGTATAVLSLTNPPGNLYGFKYRCLVDGISSNEFILRFANYWIGADGGSWENPNNWSCGKVPDIYSDVIISTGTVLLSSNVSVAALFVSPGVVFKIDPAFRLTVTGH